jgi:hypothetical protein
MCVAGRFDLTITLQSSKSRHGKVEAFGKGRRSNGASSKNLVACNLLNNRMDHCTV